MCVGGANLEDNLEDNIRVSPVPTFVVAFALCQCTGDFPGDSADHGTQLEAKNKPQNRTP